ncbi:MAG: hypothetical protein KatS3mg097_551 [Candidatus Parcubacteria bacterium]|nr:MAG: hypothetical protein KatS3mg097_551 [Candidatus Parcubacteria bacterium]
MKNYLTILEKLISFKTVSADSCKINEFKRIINFIKSILIKEGFKIDIIGKQHPLFIASKFISTSSKTIGVYCHYDVQPVEPLDQWNCDPFKMVIKNNKIYGRGVADDKGHLSQNISAVLDLLKEKKLKNNIIFIFEGEEELGSLNFEKYVNEVKNHLNKVDLFLLNDVGMIKNNVPTIYYALRGIIYFELEIWTGSRDLHSGVYGNLVYNPIQILIELFYRIRNLKGNLKIPKFYNQCRKISIKEKKMLITEEKDLNTIKKASGVFALNPLDKNFPLISSKIHPSLEVNGFISGYTAEGPKTIIPNYAKIKFSIRLIEYQDPKNIISLVKDFIHNNLPSQIKYSLKVLSASKPFYCDYKNYYFKKVSKILEEEFGNKCVFTREGGSIPAAEILLTKFNKPIILTGFILPGSNIHAPNENFDLKNFLKGINVLKKIYSFYFSEND